MISKELIEENKKKLLKEKHRLEVLLGKIAKPNPEIEGDYDADYPEMGDDTDENATEVSEYAAHVSEEQNFEVKLQKINQALERIEKGTYGLDVNTGKEISEERLKAVPEAETDVENE